MKIVKGILNLLLWIILLLVILVGSIPGFFIALVYYSVQNGFGWGKLLLEHKIFTVPSNYRPEENNELLELYKQSTKEMKDGTP